MDDTNVQREPKWPPPEAYEPRNIVIPLFRFSPNWAANSYEFTPEITLAKASQVVRDMLKDAWGGGSAGVETTALAILGLEGKAEWLLIIPESAGAQHFTKKGFWRSELKMIGLEGEAVDEGEADDEHDKFTETAGPIVWVLISAYQNMFQTAVNLVKVTDIRMPLVFKASVHFDQGELLLDQVDLVDESDELADYQFDMHSDLNDDDLGQLSTVFGALAKFWPLSEWAEEVNDDKFARRLEREASLLSRKRKTKKEAEHRDESKVLHQVFRQLHQERMHERSRLGRAIGFYNLCARTGSSLHALVFACIGLETLYTDDNDAVGHKLRVRLAHIVGATDFENRKDYYTMAKDVYKLRSHILHGTQYEPNALEQNSAAAVKLLRKSIKRILCDDKLRVAFVELPNEKFGAYMRDMELGHA